MTCRSRSAGHPTCQRHEILTGELLWNFPDHATTVGRQAHGKGTHVERGALVMLVREVSRLVRDATRTWPGTLRLCTVIVSVGLVVAVLRT